MRLYLYSGFVIKCNQTILSWWSWTAYKIGENDSYSFSSVAVTIRSSGIVVITKSDLCFLVNIQYIISMFQLTCVNQVTAELS